MAIGALLGVKIFRRNPEHVVTLDANAVEDWLPKRRGLRFCMRLRLDRLSWHSEILAQPCETQKLQ
jgi:hypothetical protein